MKPLKLKHGEPTVVRHNEWQKMEDGSFRSGNVLIRCDVRTPFGAHTFETWFIYRVDARGKLTKVHPKSRPWGYGHAGQAKIGASHLAEPVEAEGKEAA
jgi:hypothetical protein